MAIEVGLRYKLVLTWLCLAKDVDKDSKKCEVESYVGRSAAISTTLLSGLHSLGIQINPCSKK